MPTFILFGVIECYHGTTNLIACTASWWHQRSLLASKISTILLKFKRRKQWSTASKTRVFCIVIYVSNAQTLPPFVGNSTLWHPTLFKVITTFRVDRKAVCLIFSSIWALLLHIRFPLVVRSGNLLDTGSILVLVFLLFHRGRGAICTLFRFADESTWLRPISFETFLREQ